MKLTLTQTLPMTALLALGVASAQTAVPAPAAVPVTPATVSTPTDLPGSHWASEAVQLLIARGIILGYPDSTFRGTQGVTRYELAQILARVIKQDLLATPTAQTNLTRADLDVIMRGMEQVADLLSTLDVRLRDAVADIDSLKARMAVTEQALQQVVNVAATRTELEASAATVAAATRTEIQTGLASKADTSAVVAVQAQVDLLNAQVGALQTTATTAAENAEKAAISATEQQALDKAAGINGQVFTDPNSIPNADFMTDRLKSLYVGAGANFSLGSGAGIGVVVGSDRALPVLGGLGIRASGSYSRGARSYNVQGHLTKTWNTANDGQASFSPYAGLGGGVLVSPDGSDLSLPANDGFLSALGGLNYNFTETLRLFTEVDARYYLTSKGIGTGATADAGGTKIGVGVGVGLKVYF